MAYFISRSCLATCDTACVDVCPCDCIIGPVSLASIRAIPRAERGRELGEVQMFIDPDECIDCGACVPECPVEAIHQDDDAGPDLLDDLRRNAEFARHRRQSQGSSSSS
jgi:ferredoxin